jgi:hypothetical protein
MMLVSRAPNISPERTREGTERRAQSLALISIVLRQWEPLKWTP